MIKLAIDRLLKRCKIRFHIIGGHVDTLLKCDKSDSQEQIAIDQIARVLRSTSMEAGGHQNPLGDFLGGSTQPWNEQVSDFLGSNSGQVLVACLKGALALNLFAPLVQGRADVAQLSTHCAASSRGIRILCDYLAAVHLLDKCNSDYSLPPQSKACFDPSSPCYLGNALGMLPESSFIRYRDVAGAVRKGGTLLEEDFSAPDNTVWVDFAKSNSEKLTNVAEELADVVGASLGATWKVLEVGAGHGIFGIEIARKNPNASIVALDWPNVLKVAHENARRIGVGDRWTTIEGSALDTEFGGEYDLVLLPNILHLFGVSDWDKLLAKVKCTLRSEGRAIMLEFIPNEDRITPPEAAMFSMGLLVSTPAGDVYPCSDLNRMFRKAGFTKTKIHTLSTTPEKVVEAWA
jgi:cyclopropane fatty-acyl-phospholipid synthase-like methyltransferase